MAAPPSSKEDLSDEEGASLPRSAGFAHTSLTPPFLGDDPTTVGVRRAGAPGSAVAWRDPGLGYGDMTAVARRGRSHDAVLDLPLIDDPVEVSGEGVPAPAKEFGDAGLEVTVLQSLARCGFEIPTPLQSYSVPIVLAGRDLMACAPTGSGKTAAFCIPVLSGLAAMGQAGRVHDHRATRPRALLLVPTMERAALVYGESKKFTFQTGLRIGLLYGGSSMIKQLRDLEGVDVIIATPSRLLDTLKRSRISLDQIKYLVMDKADMMVNMGFDPIMRKIVDMMPNKKWRQTMIFSETFPPDVQELAAEFMANYILIVVKVETSTYLVRQSVEFITDEEKRSHLLSLLQGQYVTVTGKLYQPLTLVFVEAKQNAVLLKHFLGHKGFLSAAIHGETTLQEKMKTLTSFRDGLAPILVTTDARGLDFPNVAHVINYDFPESIEEYVYRIERAGKAAFATAFFTESNYYLAKGLLELMTKAKQDVPDWLKKYALDPRVKVDAGCLHEKDELSHWMSQLLIEEEKEEQQQQEEEATLMDDKYEECLTGVEAGFDTLSCPRESYEKTLENGVKWMSEECFLCFRKYIEHFPIEGSEHKFGELIIQCFNFDACGMIFHHYNFTVEIKHKHSENWIPQLYFAEVKEHAGVKNLFCCLLEPSDDGNCYGCTNQHVDDLKHPTKGGYEEGTADIFWPFMDDIPDSDDDCGTSG